MRVMTVRLKDEDESRKVTSECSGLKREGKRRAVVMVRVKELKMKKDEEEEEEEKIIEYVRDIVGEIRSIGEMHKISAYLHNFSAM